jgi:hypothetical protein
MKNIITWAPLFAAGLLAACASDPKLETSSPDNSSVMFAIAGADFSGSSVRICGARSTPDPKYRCDATITPMGAMECPCFDFAADGTLVDAMNDPVVLEGLCPSINVPVSNWNFLYSIFSGPSCAGTQLNDGTHNFTCFDSHDIATRANPNQSTEALVPGLNTNHILCISDTASKEFGCGSFTSRSTGGVSIT